ncbi:hypothetical protein [Devosia sp. CN2-171]|uniref:hypothetical protein n=1 Tax=Devosia sp. CN2-171 TaxID=3400909 RepID=UPI003BF82E6F
MSALDLFASALGGFVLIAIILFPYYNEDKALQQRAEQAEAATKEATEAQQAAEAAKAEAEELQASAEAAQRSAEAEAAQQTAAAEAATEARAEAEAKAAETAEQLETAQSEAEAAIAAQGVAEAKLGEAAEVQTELEQTVAALRLEVARTFLIIVVEWDADGDVDLAVTDPEGRRFYFGATNRADAPEHPKAFPDTLTALTIDNTYGPGIEVWQAPDASPGEYKIEYKLFRQPDGGSGTIPVTVKGSLFYRNGVETVAPMVMKTTNEVVTTIVRVTETGTLEVVQ